MILGRPTKRKSPAYPLDRVCDQSPLFPNEIFIFRERPAPGITDVLESTPINQGKTFSRPDNTTERMGPPSCIPSDRRQSQVSGRDKALEFNKENCNAATRRETFQPTDLDRRFNQPQRRETFVKVPENSVSWTPQKLDCDAGKERRRWQQAPVNLANFSGLQELNETEESVFGAESAADCSVDIDKYLLSPPTKNETINTLTKFSDETAKAKPYVPRIVLSHAAEEPLNLSMPLNLSTKNEKSTIYQPEVSDISLEEYSLNTSANVAGMSMAVNISEFCANRVDALDDEIADRQLEEEIEQLAVARATSACRSVINTYIFFHNKETINN